jgi:hypothetical protein
VCSKVCERKKKEKKEPAVCSGLQKKKERKHGKPHELILEKIKGVWQQV